MDCPVLKYDHKDFEVIIQTDEIQSIWERFQGRINYRNDWTDETSEARKYCAYDVSQGCTIQLYDYATRDLIEVEAKKEYWPVIYETNKYHIIIKFKDGVLYKDTKPRVKHIRSDIEKSFYFNYNQLSGEVSFLNEPGLFRLGFEYQDKDGKLQEGWFSFHVVSPKLDVKKDYHSILHAVNAEFEGLIFRYCSLTMQQLREGHHRPLEVWMQVFESVVSNYLKNVDRIIKNPHSKVRTQVLHAHADRIKRWTPAMEEEYAEKKAAEKLDEHYFRYSVYDKTVNSMENRFVKYTLQQIGKQLENVFSTVLNRPLTEISQSYIDRWKKYQSTIQKYLKHPFFDAVGKFEGMRQESLVLQGRMGYQQVYKNWLKLRKGIDFYQGTTNIGTLQIWEIYELWCFIKVKQMILRILQLDPQSPLITEPHGSLVHYQRSLSGNKSADYRVVIQYPTIDDTLVANEEDAVFAEQLDKHQGDVISIHYQHTFSRVREDDFDVRTMTTEQRPDIIVNIKKANGEVLTYLYDAKYRVWSDSNLDKTEDWYERDNEAMELLQGADYPPADAINQMHRYRDAIYYGLSDAERPKSKEVIGGYVLFPGRGDQESIENRFYSKSIQQVNIGAFPLLPVGKKADDTDPEGSQLYAHLKEILLEKETMYHHIEDAVPQRGLTYIPTDDIPDADMLPRYYLERYKDAEILIGVCKGDRYMDWILQNKLYNIRIDEQREGGFKRSELFKRQPKFVIIYNEETYMYRAFLSEKGKTWSKEQMETSGYPNVKSDLYYVFPLNEEVNIGDYNIRNFVNWYCTNNQLGVNTPVFTKVEELLKHKK